MTGPQEEFAGGKLLLRREESIAIVTFNHPERMNALELEMWGELARLVPRLDRDESVRVLVFKGAGDRAFSAGADIARFAEERSNSDQARKYAEGFLPGLDEQVANADVGASRRAIVGDSDHHHALGSLINPVAGPEIGR